MKRLAVLIALVAAVLALWCAPAWAGWYAPQPGTAYIDVLHPDSGWWEWTAAQPDKKVVHATDPIPGGWPVTLTMTWVDTQTGARLAPLGVRDTLSFKATKGKWKLAQLDPLKTVKYWSPPYQPAAAYPDEWGCDWWYPLGKLAKGSYSGWVRDMTPSAMPGWLGDDGKAMAQPVWTPAWDTTYRYTFSVK
jgi:hypothetical protein